MPEKDDSVKSGQKKQSDSALAEQVQHVQQASIVEAFLPTPQSLQKTLSLIIFAQSVSAGLRQLLRSIDQQNNSDFEVILVMPIERNFLREWISVLALKQRINWHQLHTQHRSEAYNRAAEYAQGRYLLFLSDKDTLLGVHALDRAISSLQHSTQVVCAGSRLLVLRDGHSTLRESRFFMQRYHRAETPSLLASTVIEKKLFLKVGGFDLSMGEEFFVSEFWQRALQKDPKFVFLPSVLVESLLKSRVHDGACSHHFFAFLVKVFWRQGPLVFVRVLFRQCKIALRFILLGDGS